MANYLDGSSNPYLEGYRFKRKLDLNYFRLIDQKFPKKNVCYFCLTPKLKNGSMGCTDHCNQQLEFRKGHKPIRDFILIRDNFTCQLCGVTEESLSKALKILKRTNRHQWKAKREELKIPDKRIGLLMDIDHIIPISEGGGAGMIGNLTFNLRTLCLLCHFHVHQKDKPVIAKPSKPKTKNRKVL